MIKYCKQYLLLSIITVMLFTACGKTNTLESWFMPYAQHHLFEDQGQPSKDLLDLLDVCQIKHDGSLESIVAATQLAWLRKPGTERWHLEETALDKHAIIMPLLKKLGCMQEVAPAQKTYDYALILGATVSRVRSRLAYALAQWEKGIRFKTIVFLGSERPLDAQQEPASLLLNSQAENYPYSNPDWKFTGAVPTTEHEMIKLVVEQTNFPKGFEDVTFVFVNTPMQQASNGSLRRANTIDTIHHWISMHPIAGSCVVVSNQPFVGYQDSAVRSAMPTTFKMQTVGEFAADDASIAVCLDNLARWLYQELQNKNRS